MQQLQKHLAFCLLLTTAFGQNYHVDYLAVERYESAVGYLAVERYESAVGYSTLRLNEHNILIENEQEASNYNALDIWQYYFCTGDLESYDLSDSLLTAIAALIEQEQEAQPIDVANFFTTELILNLFKLQKNSSQNSSSNVYALSFTDLSSALLLSLANTTFYTYTAMRLTTNTFISKFLLKPRKLHANLREKNVFEFSRTFTPFHSVLFSKGRDPPVIS